jgi:hypothetical protein
MQLFHKSDQWRNVGAGPRLPHLAWNPTESALTLQAAFADINIAKGRSV